MVKNLINSKIFLILSLLLFQNSFANKNKEFQGEKIIRDSIKINYVPFFHKEFDEQFIALLKKSKIKVADIDKTSKNFQIEFLKKHG